MARLTLKAAVNARVATDMPKFIKTLTIYDQYQLRGVSPQLIAKIWQAASVSTLELVQQIEEEKRVSL